MAVAEQKSLKCYHCGERCKEEHVRFEDKDFCCLGCRSVYEILNHNGLCDYYDLEKHPGISLKDLHDSDKFLFLDHADIQRKMLDFSSPDLNKVTFFIPKIHCSSCIWLLENLNRLHPGVGSTRVDFIKKKATIDYNPGRISLKELAVLLTSVGYEPHISLQDGEQSKKKDGAKSLFIKIGVAGFCFGNIMLLSFPDYLGVDFLNDKSLKPFFSALNIVLALPVVFYAGVDYLISAYKGVRQKFINIDVPIALGIVALTGRSLYEIIYLGESGYLDSLAGLIFFLLIGKWFQHKTYESLSFERDYKSYFPLAVLKERGGADAEIVEVAAIKKDDVLAIRNQEIVPCDGILLSDRAHIDYSFVTGESRTVEVEKGAIVYAGGKQTGGKIRLKAIKEASQSYLTQLWNHEAFQKEKTVFSDQLINKVSKYFTAAVLTIAGLAFAFWAGRDWSVAFNAFTAVLIVACPCALALSVPFTYGNAVRVFGRNKFYLKNSQVLETLNKATHIVFDKTGTLTETRGGRVFFSGKKLTGAQLKAIAALAFNSTHPLSRIIYKRCSGGIQTSEAAALVDFHEQPGKGLEAVVDGKKVKMGSIAFVEGTQASDGGEQTKVYVSVDGETLGYFGIANMRRPGVEEAIGALRTRYRLSMLSGDADHEKAYFGRLFDGGALRFRQRPDDKLRYIEELQDAGEKTLMVGDGLNDAGALVKSDVGIAVVEDASSFSPASDAILDAAKLSMLPVFLRFSRAARAIVIGSFIISFLYNVVGVSFAVAGALTPVFAAILMPLSSVSVVAFATAAVNAAAKFMKLNLVEKR